MFRLPLFGVDVCMHAVCRARGGAADIWSGKATAYVTFPTAVRILSRLAEQSFHKLCSTRRGVVVGFLGDSAFRWDSRCALDARTLHGAGETPSRSRFTHSLRR
ncbi:hypothetical protein Taro_014815 [Colocasia esculenta]|uniref:Uncharacterized protein n=1 Tax=Colocasia esculenta TaxID=4460 RepID=A0A843UK93_COLES|nr:hypothetical protein [Colocasia esculenta]